MSDEGGREKSEIVIVRRRGGDDGAGGKGGAWKIAYADFVTAMMAFFLVMWLINASNEETRAQVASYFNPIKLTDTSTGARSLKDMKDTSNPLNSTKGEAGEGSLPSKQDVRSEAEFMANPPQSLDRVAKTVSDADFRNAGLENKVEIAPALKPDTSNPGVGDPFDPKAWEKMKVSAIEDDQELTLVESANVNSMGSKPVEDASDAADRPSENKELPSREDPPAGEKGAQQDTPPRVSTVRTGASQASLIAKDILKELGKDAGALQQSFAVIPTKGGTLISLTERESFEMFETGSARPKPEAMRLVEAVAAALKSRKGRIVIRGHTDSRPYRNKFYDNWQLSTARAHFARYMLLRGGLDERRIHKVEGVADREPRNTQDPQAAENRRIEILIESETP